MRSWTIGVLALVATLVPSIAGAQSSSKLAIGTLRGNSSVVRRQILLQVCGPYQCVAASRYTTDDRPDPEKLAAGGVSGYLGGAVTGAAADRHVILTLTTPTTTAKKPAHTWRLRLGPDGKLRPQVLERFAIEMDEILQASSAQVTPAPSAPPQRAPPPAAKPAPPPPPPAAKPPPPRAPPPAEAQTQTEGAPREKPQTEPKEREHDREPARTAYQGPLRGAVEAGVWITNRKLSFSGANGGSLRTYDASAIFVPRMRLEGYAAAFQVKNRFLSGLGLYAEYSHSVGLKVKPPSGDTSGNRNGTLTTLDLGMAWRLRPVASSGFTLIPALGYRSLQVTTSPKIDGLPDAKLSGYELRLDLDAPVGRKFRFLAGGGYTLWTQAKELVKGGYFGKGTARGFEIEGGGQYRFWGPLHAKLMLEWQSQKYSGLGKPASSEWSASGASDSYLGARFMVRGEF
jgi:hypothetical protein